MEGTVLYFYPQGIADYNEYSRESNHFNLYPNHKIIGKVVGYDKKICGL